MIMRTKKYSVLLVLFIAGTYILACNKKWDEHNEITDVAISNNLYQAISKNTGATKFSELLVKSGFDKVISASKNYTVWVPTDAALANLDPAIVNDATRLKAFVGNHIANLAYITGKADERIPMLNGKYILFAGSKFDAATITTPNLYAANGIFHIIDKFVPSVENSYEFLVNSNANLLFKTAVTTLNYTFFDSTKATQIGVNPTTGAPIWDSTGAKILRNRFLDRVQNIAKETEEFTVIVLNDAAYTTEFNKLTPWFVTTTADSTNNLASYHLIKDLAFKGAFSATQLPDTLVSQFGVKVPIDKSKIVASYKTSNGYVHVMSQVNFTLANKFPPIIVEGENPAGFATNDRGFNTYYRILNTPNGTTFRDIYMRDYGFAQYFIRYRVNGLSNMRYNAFWVAVNNGQVAPLWQQRLAIDSSNNVTTFPYRTVPYRDYSEISLGQFTINNYRNAFNMFVVGPNVTSTSGGSGSITLDYIKLVPAF